MSSSDNKRARIDWEAVWKSLNWDDERYRQTAEANRLHQRAQQFAAPVKETDTPAEEALTVLSFDLGAEHYAVEVAFVRGVRPITRLAFVPGIPPFYKGVVNLRGQILTVMDLRLFFDMNVDDEMIWPDELVIVHAHNLEVGLLAHQVNGVTSIPLTAVRPLENMRYTLGVTRGRIVLLDIQHMFADQRLMVGGERVDKP